MLEFTPYEKDYQKSLDRIFALDERPDTREEVIREESRRLSNKYNIPVPVLARELRACFKG